jgi:ATP-dependent Clp protease ATP-binding subunit ClpC
VRLSLAVGEEKVVTSGFGGESGSFDDFIARFFGGRAGEARGPVYRVDISRLLTEPTRALIAAAAREVAQRGGRDLGTEHLLWATTRVPALAELLRAAGADPDVLAREVEAGMGRTEPSNGPPVLTPAAKRALLDAHQLSRSLGVGYICPPRLLPGHLTWARR